MRRWRSVYADLPPVGHVLRKHRRDVWLRVHYFADDRRTPETPAEEREVLARLNEIAEMVLSDDAKCVLWFACFGREVVEAATRIKAPPSWVDEADYDPKDRPSFWVKELQWKRGRLDELLLDVATGRRGPVTLFAPSHGHVMSPYDGGVDLFLRDEGLRRSVARRFASFVASWPKSA